MEPRPIPSLKNYVLLSSNTFIRNYTFLKCVFLTNIFRYHFVSDVPKLPEKIKREPEDTDEDAGEDEELIDSNPKSSSPSSKTRDKLKSGPVAADPYADDNSSYVMPIMIAFAIFIPSLLILCRL